MTTKVVDKQVSADAENKEINYTVNERSGKKYEVEVFVMEYATVRTIYNKEYFKKHLATMNEINAWLLYMEPTLKPENLPENFYTLYNLN